MKITDLETFDAIVPNEIGGLNAFEAVLAAHRFGKSVLDTDLVARAYPMIYQTVRCLNGVSVTPATMADGAGKVEASPSTYPALLIHTDEGVYRSSRMNWIISQQKMLCETQPLISDR